MIKFSKCVSAIALSMSAVLACNRQPDVAREVPPEHAQAAPAKVRPYAPGRWRLVDAGGLNDVVLWVSQILIRHRDAGSTDPAFAVADWHSRSAGAERGRTDALALAQQLRERAAGQSEPFATLASLHSEDVATQPLGGSLGGIQASQLGAWPEVLDALAALRPGEVSQVVETRYGFHVLQLRPPPPPQTVSGAHIVIAHDDARWIKVLGRGKPPARSRADALALANELYERAKQHPEAFSQLVEQYSEHCDAARAGDMGTWSNREPSYYPREVEVLTKLAVGEVAPPLDSPVGFQIILRTPNRERDRFAMEAIHLPFNDPSTKASAQTKATELAQLLREDPSRFLELKKANCCDYVEEWQDGRDLPMLTSVVIGLRIGQIASEPIESHQSYFIAKRVEPRAAPTAVIEHELPNPDAPDITVYLRSWDETLVRAELQKLGDEVLPALSLPEATAEQVRRLHRQDGRFAKMSTPESRTDAFKLLLSDVKRVLEPAAYAKYQTLVNAHFERVLLQAG